MINKFFFTIFHWQGFLVHVDDQQVSLDKFRWLKINNILATFSLLSVYTSKFLTWQFYLVKEKLARQIFLDKENLSTIPRLHEQFFLVKANLSRKNCSCKWGFKLPVVIWQTTSKNCTKKRAARAARLFSPFNQSSHWFVALWLSLPSSFLKLSVNDKYEGALNHQWPDSRYDTKVGSLRAMDTARTSSEMNLAFVESFSILLSRLAWRMCTNYVEIKLVGAVWRLEKKIENLSTSAQSRPYDCKASHFPPFIGGFHVTS